MMGQDCEIIERELSLAVYLLDDYSGDGIIRLADVSLINRDGSEAEKGKANSSNYYIFMSGNYSLQIRSEFYFYEEIILNQEELQTVILFPKPSYPFPPGETLARGIIEDNKDIPASCRTLIAYTVKSKEIFRSRITEKGEFVIYFKNLRYDDLVLENKQYFLNYDNSKNIYLKVNDKSYYIENVVFGKTNSCQIKKGII